MNEPSVLSFSNDFSKPYEIVKEKLSGYNNFLKLVHNINACSIPEHLHEIIKIVHDVNFDVLGVFETFISSNTPSASFKILGFNFFTWVEFLVI